jgi:hypothetical protein
METEKKAEEKTGKVPGFKARATAGIQIAVWPEGGAVLEKSEHENGKWNVVTNLSLTRVQFREACRQFALADAFLDDCDKQFADRR